MGSRRDFLTTAAAGLGVVAWRPAWAAGLTPEVKTALKAPIGLQLYSLRAELKKDVPGTLALVRSMGIREVEGAGLLGLSVGDMRAALDKADLVCRAAHYGRDRLRDDLPGVVKEVKGLGATWIVCSSIPHDKPFKRDDALQAAELFNKVAATAEAEGLRFAYHCHGYEFVAGDKGTLFDTLAEATDPKRVAFEIDVFWAKAGGADPAPLIDKLTGRVPFLHLKDLQKGVSYPPGTSGAPDETSVPVGTGQIDWPAVLRASEKAGSIVYYIEDENPAAARQIPQSLTYLRDLKL